MSALLAGSGLPSLPSLTSAASVLAAEVSTGEAVTFWLLAPIVLGAALALVLVRNPVHSALFLVLVMGCLAIFYAVQDAPFLAVVQVIVYTGAIMILFLFVLMIIGVDASESMLETLRGQRAAALVAGGGFALLLVTAIGQATVDAPVQGLEEANRDGHVVALARLIFGEYVVAFEVVSALLIIASLGAMVLAHRERTATGAGARFSQREQSRRRFSGEKHPAPLPGPGVYARHNAVDRPALLPDGTAAPTSVPPSIEARLPRRGEPPRSQWSGALVAGEGTDPEDAPPAVDHEVQDGPVEQASVEPGRRDGGDR